MKGTKRRNFYFAAVMLLTVTLLAFFTMPATESKYIANIPLEVPLFVSDANAENSEIGEYLDEEAGMAAWFQGDLLDLNDIRSVYSTIETETTEYIIGSVDIPNYNEQNDVHVYANVNGWILAYYLQNDPASKSFDIIFFRSNGVITSKLVTALEIVANAGGSPLLEEAYYDFRYPNATHMMTIAETDLDGENSFTLELPSSYAFYERSYAVYGNGDGATAINIMWLNGVQIARCYPYCYGTLSASQLAVDTTHTIAASDEASITLVYREQ